MMAREKVKLQNMTLEELWALFPIALVPPKESWKKQYAGMERILVEGLCDAGVQRIAHIGSTAVGTIWAKDIVDILVELRPGADLKEAAARIQQCGCLRMSASPNRISFNRGYTESGFADEVFHVHLRRAADNDELYFRDYLIEHPDAAKQYEALKKQLSVQFQRNRDAYTDAKAGFVKRITALAQAAYQGRYG